jgi:hypothetical protein
MDDGDMTTYGAVLIVKNEAANIERCLASAIAAGVTVASIVDTGSSDGTMALVRKACAGIELRLSEVPFSSMGQARSAAFAAAYDSADWLLALDADMTCEIEDGFEPTGDAYGITMDTGTYRWDLPLLLNGRIRWKSTGGYHEYTSRADGAGYAYPHTDKVRVHFVTPPRTLQKSHWIVALLEGDLLKNPEDTRTLFYLAQERRDLGDPRARETYLKRAGLGGWEEEAWWCLYQAARLAEWPARAGELMTAWERRPFRLEPLRDLVRELNDRGDHHAAYQLACAPRPLNPDATFTEPAVWDWEMDFQRSIAAWWVGYPEETRALSENLLARDDLPADVRAAVERNLGLCNPAVAA